MGKTVKGRGGRHRKPNTNEFHKRKYAAHYAIAEKNRHRKRLKHIRNHPHDLQAKLLSNM